ncbi:FUSC family protein [Actinomadura luteofluorescens]|uniref:FUSC family protein n=1 Tax=Actinomadura luteofluorescens TaxID=46163 RepID=UPI00348A829E
MALAGVRLRSAPPAAVTMAAVLAAFGSALLLGRLAPLGADAAMQAVVLSVALAGAQRGASPADRLAACVVLPLVTLAAVGLGTLMSGRPAAGDAAFVLLVTSAVWIRRFGRRFARAGTLVTLPAIALLVIPHTRTPGYFLWAPVMALIAWVWVTAFQLLADRVTATAPAPAQGSAMEPERRSPASGRMAAQMAVALAAAFATGHLLFPDHWSWVVLTSFVVCNGALGRGDALYKGFLRALGATGGTLLAALAAGTFAPGDRGSIALVFVALGVAVWLRPRNYAYWAGGVTAALSLLYGYFGQSAMPLLWTRMEAILAGGVVGVASAWFVLPFRTRDVLRRRAAMALAVLPRALGGEPGALTRFERSVAELDKLYPPLRTHRAITRRRPHHADVVDHLRDIRGHLRTLAADTTGDDRDDTAVEKIDSAVAVIRAVLVPPRRGRGSPASARPDA